MFLGVPLTTRYFSLYYYKLRSFYKGKWSMTQPLSSVPAHFFEQDPSISAEAFLLRNHRPGWMKRALARRGFRINLGEFMPSGMSGLTRYFFAWCGHHEKYYVDYEHGHDYEVRCPDCEAEWRRNLPKTSTRSEVSFGPHGAHPI